MSYVATLGNGETILGSLTGVNLNSTSDQAIDLEDGNKLISRIVVVNASGTTATVSGGIYVGANKSSTVIVAPGQTYSTLTNTKSQNLTINKDYITSSRAYVSLSVAEGSACTCDLYILGIIL